MKHFEKEKLLKEISQNEEFLEELINLSKQSLTEYKNKLELALINNDREQIKMISHAVKGLALSMICPVLAEISELVENQAKQIKMTELEKLVKDLINEIQILETEYFN